MFRTRITEMLGIQYPIVAGGMRNISRAELVAAVSGAGALGILDSSRFEKAEELRNEIRKTQSLTDKPFGVNITIYPWRDPKINDQFIEVLIEEGVKVVETSGSRGPGEFVRRLGGSNVKLIHKVTTVKHAVAAEREGANAVSVVGFERGGALGLEDFTTIILVPRTVSEVKIPVLAGGGIGDAQGMVAAMALGSEGVVIGTRFLATKESIAHPVFKDWMVHAKETDLIVISRSSTMKSRALKNKATERIIELQAKGASIEELQPLLGYNASSVIEDGNVEEGVGGCGQAVGLIHNIPTVKELIDSLINEAREIVQRIYGLI
ncbi:NAD(P)H-dependent flavin oxidoreductase [Chloroflexota bacterium]